MLTIIEGEIRRTERPTEIQYSQEFVVMGDEAESYVEKEMKFFTVVDSRPGFIRTVNRWNHVKDRKFG